MKATTMAQVPMDAATSVFEFENSADPATYVKLPGLDVIPELGTNDTYEDDTDIDATERSEMKHANPENQDLELVLKDMPGDPVQKEFTDKVIAREVIKCRITRSTGRTQSFDFKPENHKSAESAKSTKQMFGCIGKVKNYADGSVA